MSNTAAYAGGLAAVLAAAFLLARRKKATGDYLDKLGKVGRWKELQSGHSLIVKIDPGFSAAQIQTIRSAAQEWSKAAGDSRLQWDWVGVTMPPATVPNITIQSGALGPNQGGWTHITRDTGDDAKEGMMLSAVMTLDLGQINDLKGVVSHEFLHSCGLIDHAPDSVDSCLHAGGAGTPRDSDGKTLRRLYGW